MTARPKKALRDVMDRCVKLAAEMPVAGPYRIVRRDEARRSVRAAEDRERAAKGQGRLQLKAGNGR